MAVGIGQSEVYQLHIAAIAGHHHIAGLQVAVYHLLLMNVGHGLGQLHGHAPQLSHRRLCLQIVGQRHAVYPLGHHTHRDATTRQRDRLHAHCLHHARVFLKKDVGPLGRYACKEGEGFFARRSGRAEREPLAQL